MQKNIKETQYKISEEALSTIARSAYDAINRVAFNEDLPPITIRTLKFDDIDGEPTVAAFRTEIVSRPVCIDERHYCYTEEYPCIGLNESLAYYTHPVQFSYDLLSCIYHEMIHEYCVLHEIEDCDFETQYHTEQFKKAAEEHGLICEFDPEYGHMVTGLSAEMYYRLLYTMPEEVWELFTTETKRCH